MGMQSRVSTRLPSGSIFWIGLLALGAIQVGGAALLSQQPSRQAERAKEEQLCTQAVSWVLESKDEVALERGKYLVRKLDCDIVRHSMLAGL